MNKIFISWFLTIITVFLPASVYSAADMQVSRTKGAIESKKLSEPQSRIFSIHDTNQDGLLSREEYRRFTDQVEARRKASGRPIHRKKLPPCFERVDDNRDGYITEDEMVTALNKRLRQHRRYRYHGGRW